jgi:hypothetical protein
MNLRQDSKSPSPSSGSVDLAVLARRELIVVPNLKEGKDLEVDEDLNNVDLLVGDMIVIEVCSIAWKRREYLLNDRIQSRPSTT